MAKTTDIGTQTNQMKIQWCHKEDTWVNYIFPLGHHQ